MNSKSYLIGVAFIVVVGEHRCVSSAKIRAQKSFDCDNPTVPFADRLDTLTSLSGFEHKRLKVLYNGRVNRTEFVSVVLEKGLLRDNRSGCAVHRDAVQAPDDAGHIVADRLGGSCYVKNVFPQNVNCNRGLWKTYEGSVADDVSELGRVKYCVQLMYADRRDKRPVKIVSHAYTYPGNRRLNSITIDNPPAGQCHRMPQRP